NHFTVPLAIVDLRVPTQRRARCPFSAATATTIDTAETARNGPRCTADVAAAGCAVRVRQAGIAMRPRATSGNGQMASAALTLARHRAISAGKGAVFLASMSTCSDMFSDVAATQPSVA